MSVQTCAEMWKSMGMTALSELCMTAALLINSHFKRSIAPGNGLMGDIDCRRLHNLPSVKVAINEGMITWAQLINSSGALQSPSLINPPSSLFCN